MELRGVLIIPARAAAGDEVWDGKGLKEREGEALGAAATLGGLSFPRAISDIPVLLSQRDWGLCQGRFWGSQQPRGFSGSSSRWDPKPKTKKSSRIPSLIPQSSQLGGHRGSNPPFLGLS